MKIVECITVDGALTTADGRATPMPIIIHADDDGVLWYWTPDE